MHSWLTILLFVTANPDPQFLEQVRTTPALTPAEQLKRFKVPDGFEVQLVAAEPQLQKPMNVAFDAEGRIWVSGSVEYPYAAEGEAGRDTIRVLSDLGEDGRARRITTFAEGLNIPMGLYPYKDGVVTYTISRFVWFRDTDGDGKSDQQQVIYGPLNRPRDTHGMQNAFRRGGDGWLYVNHGFANDTTLTGRDGSSIQLNSGNTYRIRLDGSRVEQVSWGQVNPFGSAWTDRGDLITADCHSRPLTLVLRGGRYSSFGKPHDGLGFAPDMMVHQHGSTGLAGVAYYEAGDWPEEYRQSLFVGNVVTSRVHRDHLRFDGATARADEQPDFLTCDDPWFRPVDLRFGPDGALYILDFYNRIIGHYEVPLEHPGRDRERGRIWRVVYRGKTRNSAGRLNLANASPKELVASLNDASTVRRYLAMDRLSDSFRFSDVPKLLELAEQRKGEANWRQRVMSRWVLHRWNELTDDVLLSAVLDEHALAKSHGLRLVSEQDSISPKVRNAIVDALQSSDANVVRAAADAMTRHVDAQFFTPLLGIVTEHTSDTALHYMLRRAIFSHLTQLEMTEELRNRVFAASQLARQSVADICLADKSPSSARMLLTLLRDPEIGKAGLAPYVLHVIKHLGHDAVEDLGRLTSLAINRCQGLELEEQMIVFAAIDKGIAADVELPQAFGSWRQDLMQQFNQRYLKAAPRWQVVGGSNGWSLESRRATDGRSDLYLSSLPGGETSVSAVTLGPFPAPSRLSFYLCGHRGDPNQVSIPSGDRLAAGIDGDSRESFLQRSVPDDCYVQLRELESNKVVRRVFPPRNDTAREVVWELSDVDGKTVQLELVDRQQSVAYAWLAIGRLSPELTKIHDLRELATFQQAGVELAGDDTDGRDLLRRLAQFGVDPSVRAASATKLARLHKQHLWLPFTARTKTINWPRTDLDQLKQRLLAGVVSGNAMDVEQAIQGWLKRLSQNEQREIAAQWIASAEGRRRLLSLIDQAAMSAQLVHAEEVRPLLERDHREEVQQLLRSISSQYPAERHDLQAQIDGLHADFAAHGGQAETGKQLYVKNCQVCHSATEDGRQIAPQLTGVGQRGAKRLFEDVMAPSRNVDPHFRTSILELADGRVLTGLVRPSQQAGELLIYNAKGEQQTVEASDVELRTESSLSLMPANFHEQFNVQQRRDLIAYLLSL